MWKSEKTIRREVDEELEFHLSMAAADRQREGRDGVAARFEAERAFGDRGAIRRACVRQAVGLRRYVVAAAAIALVGSFAFAVKIHNDVWSRVSPFTRVEQTAAAIEVALPDGGEYELVAIDGIEVDAILEHCHAVWGDTCEKRFAEDLVQVLQSMGHDPGNAVDLRLRDPATGVEIARARQPMTSENRRAVRHARRDAGA